MKKISLYNALGEPSGELELATGLLSSSAERRRSRMW